MENINNEKKSFFKSKMFIIPMVALMLLSLVSAAVYVYVSNTSTVTVTIDRAMQTWIGANEADTSISLNAFGGDNFNFVINERNNGNNPAQVYNVLLEISGPTNFAGDEFTSISTVAEGVIPLSALKFIRADGSYAAFSTIASESTSTAKLMFATDGINLNTFVFGSGVTHTSDITVTTALGIAPGTYTIKACTINNLVGATCL